MPADVLHLKKPEPGGSGGRSSAAGRQESRRRVRLRNRGEGPPASPRHRPQLDVLDVVDPALLAPPDIPIRGGWRLDAALVLDRELTKLAGMRAHCRFVQASIAKHLVELRGWRWLGFVRLSDYSRERLGVSPRTIEDDARVATALDALPVLRRALSTGEIAWTTARLLVRVATSGNEAQLLEESRHRTTREFEAMLAERVLARKSCGNDSTDQTGTDANASAVSGNSGDDASPAGSYASLAGDDASPAGDNHAPPGLSDDDDDPEVPWHISLSRTGRRLWRAASELASRTAGCPLSSGPVLELVAAEAMGETPLRDAGSAAPWTAPPEVLEQRLRERSRRRELRGEAMLRGFLAEVGVVDGFDWLDAARTGPGTARCLDDHLEGLDAADAFELDRRLGALRLANHRVDAQLAALLRTGIDRRLFRELGFATVKLYVESRLGFSSRTAWSLVAVERASWHVGSTFREAWRTGRVSHLAATMLLPILREANAPAWIERAQKVTLRRLADEISWATDRDDAAAGRDFAPPPLDADLRTDGAPSVAPHEVQMRAHGDGGRGLLTPPGAVRLRFQVPLSVAVLVETALSLHQRGGEPPWRTFERIVALAIEEWTRAPRHRDPVFERDGWRCTVPACSSRRNLHDHHVLFRSHGGDNGRDNRTTVCAAHHLHGIHAGIVRARGRAPDRIDWELGCRRNGPPLMRLFGDRVVVSASSWR